MLSHIAFRRAVGDRPRTSFGLPALLLLGAVALGGCEEQSAEAETPAPAPPPVTVAKPVVREIVEMDEFTGRFAAVDAVEIRARVPGYLASVHFRDGSIVRAGELLFVIDARPYEAALAEAEATLESARARLEFARQEVERFERLSRTGAAPERTFDERRQQFNEARADVAGAEAAIQKARLDLGFTQIRAPITGRISRKLVTEGNLVTPNETLLTTIVSVDPIYFYFDIDERSYLAYSRLAQDGTRNSGRDSDVDVLIALADEDEATHPGKLNFLDNRLDQATGTMRSRAVVPNPNLLFTPGMFGRIAIPGTGLYKAILVPDEAIGADLNRRFVYVVAPDGSVSQKVVRPGSRHDGYRVIRDGLTGDETIIVNGLQRVRLGGGKVTPQMTELPPSRIPPP